MYGALLPSHLRFDAAIGTACTLPLPICHSVVGMWLDAANRSVGAPERIRFAAGRTGGRGRPFSTGEEAFALPLLISKIDATI